MEVEELKWKRITQIVVIVAVLAIVCYDVFAYFAHGVDTTISRVVLGWSKQWPVIPFGVGVVSGHLFWPQPASKIS